MTNDFTKGDRVKYLGPGPLHGQIVQIDQRTSKTRFRVIVQRDDGTSYGTTTVQSNLVRQ